MAVQLRKITPWIVLCSFALPLFAHAAAINPPPNNLGLVGYWSFNEGSGTTISDNSGNSNSGTLVGNPAWISGKFDRGLTLNGSTDYVAMVTGTTLSFPDQTFTVSFWEKETTSGGTWFMANQAIGGGWGIQSTGVVFLKDTLNSQSQYTPTAATQNILKDGKWHHVVYVITTNTTTASSQNVAMYIDGVLDGGSLNKATVYGTASRFMIGTRSDSNGQSGTLWPGSIDELRIYSRGLSSTEISALYNAQAAKISGSVSPGTLANGLVGWWTLDGKDIITSFIDRAGNGLNGYLAGTNNATSSRKTIGKVGQGFSFAGQNTGGIDLGTSASLTPTNFTIAGWIYFTSSSYCYNYIYSNSRDVSGGNGIDFKVYCSGSLSGNVWNGGSSSGLSTSIASKAGTWTHVAFTADGSNLRLYVNGAQAAQQTQTVTPGAPAFHTCIGSMGNSNCTTYTINGKMDDVRLYSRALSALEIKLLYGVGVGATTNTSSASLQTGSTLASGLVGFWTFNGSDIASSILDKSGSGNNGYLFNGATSTSQIIGKTGQAFYFNGSDYIDAGPGLTTTLNGSFSFSFWVKRTRTGQELVVGHDTDTTGTSNASLILGFRPTTNKFTFAFWANDLDSVTAIADTNWHLISGTYDAITNSKKIYIDGNLDNSNTPTSDYIGTGNLCMGGGCAGWGNTYFKGSLDDFRIYNRVLSGTEIKQLYNMGK